MRYHFADCVLDQRAHAVTRAGETVHVEPQVFDLLVTLAEAGTALVTYDDLIEKVWSGRIVSDSTLAARISAARTAVGDDGRRQAVIRTVARRGVQMVVPVRRDPDGPRPPEACASSRPSPPSQPIRFARSADGNRIAYASSGSGPPLLRGGHWLTHIDLDWQSPIWRPLLECLSRHHTVFRYDQRGTGLSDREFEACGIDAFAGDVRAVMDAAEIERAPIFAASQGCAIALAFAAAHPDRVSRLVLYAGFAQGRYHRGDEAARQEARASLELVRTGWGRSESPFMRLFCRLYAPSATPEQIAHLAELQLASASGEGAARLRDIVDRFDVSSILPLVTAPTLLLHARGDAVQPMAQSQLMARLLPNATFVPLDGDDHVPLPHTSAWTTLMAETERFLAAGQ